MNIRVRSIKPFKIVWWWIDTDSFMNGNIFILEFITDIQNPGSESMHSRDSNVYSEGFIVCHWTIGLTKINTLNMRTHMCTVTRNKCT